MYQVTKLHYHIKRKELDVYFDNEEQFTVSTQLLRVYSPSAEVFPHGSTTPNLILNKSETAITQIEPVGHYAVRIVFDDGHNSGIFSWQYLRKLCVEQSELIEQYQERVVTHQAQADSVPIKFVP